MLRSCRTGPTSRISRCHDAADERTPRCSVSAVSVGLSWGGSGIAWRASTPRQPRDVTRRLGQRSVKLALRSRLLIVAPVRSAGLVPRASVSYRRVDPLGRRVSTMATSSHRDTRCVTGGGSWEAELANSARLGRATACHRRRPLCTSGHHYIRRALVGCMLTGAAAPHGLRPIGTPSVRDGDRIARAVSPGLRRVQRSRCGTNA